MSIEERINRYIESELARTQTSFDFTDKNDDNLRFYLSGWKDALNDIKKELKTYERNTASRATN